MRTTTMWSERRLTPESIAFIGWRMRRFYGVTPAEDCSPPTHDDFSSLRLYAFQVHHQVKPRTRWRCVKGAPDWTFGEVSE